MISTIRKAFSFLTIHKLLSTAPFGLGFKMVRYFANPYEDYKSGTVVLDKAGLGVQIDEHLQNITKRLQPISKNVVGGLYVGVTGVAFMFYYLSKNAQLSANKRTYLKKGLEYIKPALETSAGDRTSFLLGDAGTMAIATVLNKEDNDARYTETLKMFQSLYNTYLNPKFLKCGGDEFFVGRSGYLAGALWMSRELKMEVLSREQLHKICDVIVESGRDYARKHNYEKDCPLMYHYYSTKYLGAAHGISFILQMLLTVPGYLEHSPSAAKDIKRSVQFIATLQTDDGNWPCCMEETHETEHKLVHWCHGAPGTVYLMAKAYLVFKDQRYLDACVKAADLVWEKGMLRKGPGICHGVAGNGYVFLLLYRLTRDQKYVHRANVFANFMNTKEFLKDARVPDNPQSLYEGLAGTVCFLADLLVPEKAEFPFQDVFSVY